MIDTTWARGIDISVHNARTPNLRGRDFVFVRASYGRAKDRRWDSHSRNVLRAGAILGAYAFGVYGDGAAQADAFLAIARDAALLALDLETEPDKRRMTRAQARAFIARTQDTGREIGLYHSVSGFPDLGQDWSWPAGGAGWDTVAGSVTPPKRDWTFWQYRGSPLDLDVFHGDRSALEAFVQDGVRGVSEMIRARGALAMSGGSARFLKVARVMSTTPLLDGPGGMQVAMAQPGYVYLYVGASIASTRAVLVNTPKPYADGIPGPTVLYVAASAIILEDIPVLEAKRTIQVLLDGKPVGAPIIVGGR